VAITEPPLPTLAEPDDSAALATLNGMYFTMSGRKMLAKLSPK